jgi:hypothetical protein
VPRGAVPPKYASVSASFTSACRFPMPQSLQLKSRRLHGNSERDEKTQASPR